MKPRILASDTSKWIVHCVVCTLYILIAFTLSEFITEPTHQFVDIVVAIIHSSIIFAFTLLLTIIVSAINHWLFIACYSILCLIGAVLTYFKYTIRFALSPSFIDVMFNNQASISAELITPSLIVFSFLGTIAGSLIASYRTRYHLEWKKPAVFITIGIALVGITILVAVPRLSRSFETRIPFIAINSVNKYIDQYKGVVAIRNRQCQYATIDSIDTPMIIVVIGESLRSANIGMNGYHRNTTPRLEALGAISFDKVYGIYGTTIHDVPHMLTRADRNNPERAKTERSFIDIFKCAGLHSAAITNQDLERNYRYFLTEDVDTTISATYNISFSTTTSWLDTDMLPHYNNLISTRHYNLIVLHSIGSHWWYNTHYTEQTAQYQPAMTSNHFMTSDSMQIVNSYDNTVLYTDYFLSEVIRPLQGKNAIMLYLSDHGENLGENGKWLHASDITPQLLHVAAFVWMSDTYKTLHPDRYNALLNNRHNTYYSDYLYHTAIEAANIQTDVLDSTMTLFYMK